MIVSLEAQKKFDIKTLRVKARVRYWEDSDVNGETDVKGDLIPCREGDYWKPEIDIQTGKILNWEHGKVADIHYKVVDQCGWEITDKSGNVVLSDEEQYVPITLSPKEEGYGDYMIMDIQQDGTIADWKFNLNDFIQ